MKSIGMFGGLSPYSTALYYYMINHYFLQDHLFKTAPNILIFQTNMCQIIEDMALKKWGNIYAHFEEIGQKLKLAGASALIMPCNTLHQIVYPLQQSLDVKFINMLESVKKFVILNNHKKIFLIGSKHTMSSSLYHDYFDDQYNVNLYVPGTNDQQIIDNLIFQKLCHGCYKHSYRLFFLHLFKKYHQKYRFDAVILGCTELSLLQLGQDYFDFQLIDSLNVHSIDIIKFMTDSCL